MALKFSLAEPNIIAPDITWEAYLKTALTAAPKRNLPIMLFLNMGVYLNMPARPTMAKAKG